MHSAASLQRGSILVCKANRAGTKPASPFSRYALIHRRTVRASTPTSSPLAAQRSRSGRLGSNGGRGSPSWAMSGLPDRNPVRTSRTCAAFSRTSASSSFDRLDNSTAAGTMSSVDSGPAVSSSNRTRALLTNSTTDIRQTELGPRRTTSVPLTVGNHSVTSCSAPSYITRVPTPIRTPAPLMTNSSPAESISTTRLSTDRCAVPGPTADAAAPPGPTVLRSV